MKLDVVMDQLLIKKAPTVRKESNTNCGLSPTPPPANKMAEKTTSTIEKRQKVWLSVEVVSKATRHDVAIDH